VERRLDSQKHTLKQTHKNTQTHRSLSNSYALRLFPYRFLSGPRMESQHLRDSVYTLSQLAHTTRLSDGGR
jgi:hypothetical protein